MIYDLHDSGWNNKQSKKFLNVLKYPFIKSSGDVGDSSGLLFRTGPLAYGPHLNRQWSQLNRNDECYQWNKDE